MFHVSYRPENGAIVNYSEVQNASEHHTPEGCEMLIYASVPEGFTNSNGSCMMKVHTETKELIPLNPKINPKPLNV